MKVIKKQYAKLKKRNTKIKKLTQLYKIQIVTNTIFYTFKYRKIQGLDISIMHRK